MFTHLFGDALTSSVSALLGVLLAAAGVYLARRRPDLRNWIAGTTQIVLFLMLAFAAYSFVSGPLALDFFSGLALFTALGYGGLILLWWSGDGRVLAGASAILALQSPIFILHPTLWSMLPQPNGRVFVVVELAASLCAAVVGRHGRMASAARE